MPLESAPPVGATQRTLRFMPPEPIRVQENLGRQAAQAPPANAMPKASKRILRYARMAGG